MQDPGAVTSDRRDVVTIDPPEPFGVYLHIPFCASKCEYCAFATWTDRGHLIDAYLDALAVDVERSIASGALRHVTTVFVGGGTPSLVPAVRLAAVISSIPLLDGAEVTVECNPDDIDESLLEAYLEAGVNRISVGVQSMVDRVLISLGRQHESANVARAVDAIRNVGVPSFNLDVIYGASGEREQDWERTISSIIALDPPHVSAYGLTVEPGTALAAQPDRHPDDDDQASKYELADEVLSAAGLENYEVSNWARPGHESQHNQLYWRQQDYLGIGCAAHSHRSGRRWWNVRTPERYVALVAADESTESAAEDLDPTTRRIERLQLAVRTRDGVALDAFEPADAAELVSYGLLEQRGDRWVLTRSGRLLANEVAIRVR